MLVNDKTSGKKVSNAASRACNVMVHNPIYDGPVYESIPQPRFDTLTSAVPNHSPDSPQKSPSHSSTNSDPLEDSLTARYVKQPPLARSRPDSTRLSDQCNSCDAVSTSAQGSETNNLHLALPMDITSCNSVGGTANSLMPADVYTVMSPAGTITASMKEKE